MWQIDKEQLEKCVMITYNICNNNMHKMNSINCQVKSRNEFVIRTNQKQFPHNNLIQILIEWKHETGMTLKWFITSAGYESHL